MSGVFSPVLGLGHATPRRRYVRGHRKTTPHGRSTMLDKLRKRLRSQKGFTLIELLVVMIILAILTAIAIPSYLSFRDRANKSAAAADLRSAIPSVEAFFADNGLYTGMTAASLRRRTTSRSTRASSRSSRQAHRPTASRRPRPATRRRSRTRRAPPRRSAPRSARNPVVFESDREGAGNRALSSSCSGNSSLSSGLLVCRALPIRLKAGHPQSSTKGAPCSTSCGSV